MQPAGSALRRPAGLRGRALGRHSTTQATLHLQSAPVEYCTASNWRQELSVPGAVVALGKFDAMHIGHRQLAVTAALGGGHPYLLSFSGMAQVLNWPHRDPLVAEPDRARVLRSWAPCCGGEVPRQRYLPFSNVRSMSPEEFVQYLAIDLRAAGVVAGSNYRFGFKAAGDAEALQQYGRQYGMGVHIVELVQQATGSEQVSSSKVREALSQGRMDAVAACLDRRYRLVLDLRGPLLPPPSPRTVRLPAGCALNQPPAPGSYVAAARLVRHSADIADCADASDAIAVDAEVAVEEGGALLLPASLLTEWVAAGRGFGYALLDFHPLPCQPAGASQ